MAKKKEGAEDKINAQLNYAQKIINILQTKLNESNGAIVQLEAQIQMAKEEREILIKQLPKMDSSKE